MKKIVAQSRQWPQTGQGFLPRQMPLVIVGTLLLLLFILAPAAPVYAATITVDGTTCTLDDAITSANTDTATDGCTAGSGTDTIDLQTNVLLASALPQVTTPIILEGNGNTIDGNNSVRVLNISASGNLTLNNATITGGAPPTGNGGGIFNAGTLTVNNSTITGNTTIGSTSGGGIASTGTLIVNNSTINANTALGAGGIAIGGGTAAINNSTISNNSTTAAAGGGGGFVNIGALTLNNSTVTGNSTGTTGGGGIYSTGTTNLNRSLISGNLASSGPGPEINNSGTFNGNNFNVIGVSGASGTVGFTPSGTDVIPPGALNTVLNTALADNGGPTQTHALVSGSPAINLVTSGLSGPIDQRGAARDFGGGGDAGAYEARESIIIGTCGGADLSGPQDFMFGVSGNTVTIDVNTANGLSCITVEEMGPGANHLIATGLAPGQALMTNNWWYITGNVTSGFDVDITLPFAAADAESRVCKYPGNLGGFGWDCGDDTDNSAGSGTVTRVGVIAFSDWAVGDTVGPTALTLQDITTVNSGTDIAAAALLGTAALALGSFWLRRRLVVSREK